MPLLPSAEISYSPLSSKSAGEPPFHIRNVLAFKGVEEAFIWPVTTPSIIFQTAVSPSHPLSVFPSNRLTNPSSVLTVSLFFVSEPDDELQLPKMEIENIAKRHSKR